MAHSYLPAFLLLLAGLCLAEVVSLRTLADNRVTDLAPRVHIRKTHDAYASGINEPLDLLDIVLVASVDGHLHALNRTSGHALWTISSASPASADTPSTLGPLVRTRHPEPSPDADGDDGQEVYVIEPQTGEIYVMASPDSPLQRLPVSVPQLVETSPYSMAGDESTKLFVGKKETSLLLVELETGRIKATINPSAECIWDPFEDLSRAGDDDELDLDELEGERPPKPVRPTTEVFIGRTDYHISILTRPLDPHTPRPPVQNLSFSTYGPNNQDHALQTIYRRTADEMYIQSLPNGKIMSFKTKVDAEGDMAPSAHPVWAQSFENPVVAVFDVVKSASRAQPFVLLQPRVGLQDLLPNVDLVHAAKQDRLNLDAAYVGMVGDSLYAMSADRYPLVMFGDATSDDDAPSDAPGIDPPPGLPAFDGGAHDRPADLDAITRRMKRKKLREMCRNGSRDRRCLVGVRKLESSRLSRLLDGAATVPRPPYDYGTVPPAMDDGGRGSDVTVDPSARVPPYSGLPRIDDTFQRRLPSSQALSTYAAAVIALIVAIWVYFKKNSRSHSVPPPSPIPVSVPVDEASSPLPESTLASSPPDIQAPEPIEAKATDSADDATLVASDDKASPAKASAKRVTFGGTVKVSGVDTDGLTDGVGEGEESDDNAPATPGKRKPIRRRRGKKKKAGVANSGSDAEKAAEENGGEAAQEGLHPVVHVASPSAMVVPPPTPSTPVIPSLIVSDTVLGYGSHGTVVFKGELQGRAVAVKRLLQDFVTLATREVDVLQESDDHPNVIRYYYKEARAGFQYIALELCPASLADVVERPDQFRELAVSFEPKRALADITRGLRHLHALKIVHRDIKPQNILVAGARRGGGGPRMLISDFGLCKRLDVDQTSFVPTVHGAMAAGTVGWRAPEILRGEVKLDDPASEESLSSRGSVGGGGGEGGAAGAAGKPARLTKAVDIFALGCLFFYVLSNGGHPFGDRYEREANIFKNVMCLDGLERFGEEGVDAVDLITKMLSPEARERPDTTTCLLHPYFWNPGKRLTFLQDASDRFEIMCREPREPLLAALERGAAGVVGGDWHARLDRWFVDNLGKYRKYDGRSVQDLLRALRNKKHHYQDLPDPVKRQIGSMPEGFLAYFTKRFPHLFLHVHAVVASSALRRESMFRTYFELVD